MNINWKLVGKFALGVATIGTIATTTIFVVSYVKKKRAAKKFADSGFDGETKEQEAANEKESKVEITDYVKNTVEN